MKLPISLKYRVVVDFLNDFFSHIVDPILANHGVVNKYIGDCVLALFGVPDKISDHPRQGRAFGA